MTKGWRYESDRHALASKGISTKMQSINHKKINDDYNFQLNSFQTAKLPDGSKIVIKSIEALSKELGSGKYIYGIVERVKDDEVTHRFRTKIYPGGLHESWSKVDVQIDNKVGEIMNELGYNPEIIKSDKYRSLGRKNSDITFHPTSGKYHWVVLRDSGAVYDEGWTESPTEAEILVEHHLDDMYEEEMPTAKGFKLNNRAPYKNITEFMEMYDMSRKEANRYIRKWYPTWIDYEHPMSQEELKDKKRRYKTIGGNRL